MTLPITKERKIWKDGETLLEEDINKILQKCEIPVKYVTATALTPEEIEEKANILNDLYPIDSNSSMWEGVDNIPDNIQQAASSSYFIIYKLNNIIFKDITNTICYFSYEDIGNTTNYKEFNIDYIISFNSILIDNNNLIYVSRVSNAPILNGLMHPECPIKSAGEEDEVYFVILPSR